MEDRLFDAIDEAFESIIFIHYRVRSVQERLEEEYMMKNNIDFPILKTLDPLEERTSLKVKKMLQNGRMNYKAKRSSNELKAILKLFPNEPTDVAWCSGQKRNRSTVSSQPLVQMVKKAVKLEQTSADINKDAQEDYLLNSAKPAGIDMASDLLSAVVVDEEAKGDPQNMSLKIKSSLSLKLNWKLRLSIINEAAENLIYLNKQDSRGTVIHGDLKSSNILLDADMNPKISDFGLAKENRSEVIKKSTINANRLLGCLVGSDKSCPREVAVDDDEHVRCQACQWTEALMKTLYAKVKSWLKISDFERLDEEYKKSNDNSIIPSYLDYVTKGIGRDNIAARAILSDDILVLPCAFFYAVIDEMHNMKLKDINDEDVILKWGAVIRDAKKMRLDVEFAEEHLKKIAHAYFLSSKGGQAPAPAPAAEKISCSMSGAECFDDGAILSKGILFPPTNATPQTVVPKQEN